MNIHEVPPERGRERQLTDLSGRPGRLDSLADTDGKCLYFTWSDETGDVWVMDIRRHGQ